MTAQIITIYANRQPNGKQTSDGIYNTLYDAPVYLPGENNADFVRRYTKWYDTQRRTALRKERGAI